MSAKMLERGFVTIEQHEIAMTQCRNTLGRMRMLERRMAYLYGMLDRLQRGVPIDPLEREMVDEWIDSQGEPK